MPGATMEPTARSGPRGARALRRHPLAVCLGAVCLVMTPVRAAVAETLFVTNCADDGSPGTLRSVVDSAVDGDVVDLTQLTCSTITLTQGTIGTDFLSGHPVNYLTIQGPGRDVLTISGGGKFLVFSVGGYGSLPVFTLSEVTIAHGVNFNTASPWYEGGACIFSVSGAVVLDRVAVTDCHSTYGGGVGGGGAVDAAGLLQIIGSVISDSSVQATGGNTAQGGAAWVGGRMEVIRSTITGNSVTAPLAMDGYGGRQATGGGGVYSAGDLIVIDSTISGNTVEATEPGQNGCGGAALARGTITISNSTFSGNVSDGDGGALCKLLRTYLNDESEVAVGNSTITDNSAGSAGGALVSQRAVTIANSTIAFNQSILGGAMMFRVADIDFSPPVTTLGLQSSIVASNAAGAGAPYAQDLAVDAQLMVDGANSLVMQADPEIALPPDTLSAHPRLLPLAWNGGPTATHALAADSPAIDAGNNSAGLAFDQRGEGFPRVNGPAADIGAFEFAPAPDAIFASGFDP